MSEPAPPPPVRLVIDCREPAALAAFAPGLRVHGAPWGTPTLTVRDREPVESLGVTPVPAPAALGLLILALAALAALALVRRAAS